KDSLEEIPTDEKASLVKGVFDSCGWRTFAPLVVFTGHVSHSANNPYASSLDCGACAGNPGKRNARTLARLANSKEVRKVLCGQHGIDIPEDTIFIAAEHITSTDDVQLFDNQVPESYYNILQQLKKDLAEVKKSMTKERLNEPQKAVAEAKIKSNSWSEARPEWGLSGHAGYIIGPRSLTVKGEFSDCFLSSYDWRIDKDGSILKGIMQGPLLVCQWISNHYYFSTVDNEVFGGGSKITHNITGKYGVMQGNGSDLKMGLPLQSLMKTDDEVFHNPIRLSTLIQAPKRFITQILASDEKLKGLLDNGWIYLFIMDPEKNNIIERYH
ncbi:MAG TPA: putative inorganic carbon transporter subunit DabA, partial [Chitinophagaceae bacterium]